MYTKYWSAFQGIDGGIKLSNLPRLANLFSLRLNLQATDRELTFSACRNYVGPHENDDSNKRRLSYDFSTDVSNEINARRTSSSRCIDLNHVQHRTVRIKRPVHIWKVQWRYMVIYLVRKNVCQCKDPAHNHSRYAWLNITVEFSANRIKQINTGLHH